MTNRQGDKPISKTSSARAGTRIKKQVVTLSPCKWREDRESQCGNRVVCEEMRERGERLKV